MRFGKVFALLLANNSVRQINFVSNEDFRDLLVGVLVDLPEPVLDVVKSLLLSDVVNKNNAHSAFVVCLSDCSEPLLPGSVPDL